MNFNVRLKQLRQKHKLTQSELADILGLKPTAISNYESKRNEPSFDKLIALSKHFDVSCDYLLGVSDAYLPIGGEVLDKDIINFLIYINNWMKNVQKNYYPMLIIYFIYKKKKKVMIMMIKNNLIILNRETSTTMSWMFFYCTFPQQNLYFLPLPHGHGSFLPTFLSLITVPDIFCSLYNSDLLSFVSNVSQAGNSYNQSALAATIWYNNLDSDEI